MTFNLSESDSFKEMYDTFARHCNENPVSAVADLKANKEAVEHHIKELKSGIEEQYQEITSLLSSGLITENFQAERDRILTQIRESISNEDYVNDPNQLLELEEITRKFYKRTISGSQLVNDPSQSITIEAAALSVRSLSHAGRRIHHARQIIRVLNYIIGTVINRGYIGENLQLWDDLSKNEQKKIRRPHNYAGELSEKCIEELEKYVNKNPRMGVNKFFRTAHAQFDSCRKALKTKKDGKQELKSISWGALRNKTREARPDIYNKADSRKK